MVDSFDFRQQLNSHTEESYKKALEYLDTKRDRDTLKYLLTRISSIHFMAKLHGTLKIIPFRTVSPKKLKTFGEIMQDLTAQKSLSHLSPEQ